MSKFRLIVISLSVSVAPSFAQLNKCVSPGGHLTYSDRACPTNSAASAITAAPIAAPTPQDAAAAEDRRRSINEQAAELDRKRDKELREARAKALTDAGERVQHIKNRNFDPRRCAVARHALSTIKQRDPIGWSIDVSAFEHQQQIALYCGQ